MIPLGQEESQKLEFKGRDALQKPSGIARGVVAMLNAEGGSIWIGLGEASGRAVDLQPVANAAAERDRLWNHLVDTIEPPPVPDEIQVEVVPLDAGSVLRVDIAPQEDRRPYAQLKEGGRHFVIRTGARIRPMTREEMHLALGSSRKQGAHSAAESALEVTTREREALLHSKSPTFWLRLQPDQELGIDIQSPRLEDYLRNPTLSGSRVSGWTFANPHVEIRVEQNRRVLGSLEWGRTTVERSGAIDHRVQLDRLHWLPRDDPREIYPFALLEKTVSVFRLARAIYLDPQLNSKEIPSPKTKRGFHAIKTGRSRLTAVDFHVVADLALTSARGWKLRAYSPKSNSWAFGHHKVPGFEHLQGVLTADLFLERPLVFKSSELLTSTDDRCAFRLISRVYEAFGLAEDKIPSEFDRSRGILVMPE